MKEIGMYDEQYPIDELIKDLLLESKVVHKGEIDSHRWWNICTCVIKIKDMYISFDKAESTGDNTPYDLGWEFDLDYVFEVKPEKIIVESVIYKPVE
ncbi:MAG: hypothetical protein KKB59_19090 [Spirochaetes bacterium]|nr:hypothetical protein [Spirochaetota bacterium]